MAGTFWKLLGHYNAETSTWSACAGTAQTSPYTPDFNGRLVGLRTQCSLSAATSLSGHIQLRLSNTGWTPNVIECYAQGHGLETAPAPASPYIDFPVDQPITPTPIVVEGRCTDSTPVTVETYVYGKFIKN